MIVITDMAFVILGELYEIMKKHKEIRRSEFGRQATQVQVQKLKTLYKLSFKSRLTEKNSFNYGIRTGYGLMK